MKTLAFTILMGLGAVASAKDKPSDKIPVTTASPDARDLYMKAQDLADKLRGTDAHELFAKAAAKDKDFALAYLGMANTGGTAKDFFESLGKAVALEGKVSPGEKLLIQAADQGAKNDLAHQKESLDNLAQMFPSDERVANQLGAYYFGRQDYAQSIASYEKAIKINPAFTQPYNQLGYAYRFSGKLPDAERTFKKYIELIPGDPNPYDSYAELLMEEGKFADSIASYKKALAIDGNFVASYIGIGNDQMFEGKGDDARKTFAQFAKVARTDGERRQAIFWTVIAYSFEGAWDKALAEGDKMVAIANERKDNAMLANDYNLLGNTRPARRGGGEVQAPAGHQRQGRLAGGGQRDDEAQWPVRRRARRTREARPQDREGQGRGVREAGERQAEPVRGPPAARAARHDRDRRQAVEDRGRRVVPREPARSTRAVLGRGRDEGRRRRERCQDHGRQGRQLQRARAGLRVRAREGAGAREVI